MILTLQFFFDNSNFEVYKHFSEGYLIFEKVMFS